MKPLEFLEVLAIAIGLPFVIFIAGPLAVAFLMVRLIGVFV